MFNYSVAHVTCVCLGEEVLPQWGLQCPPSACRNVHLILPARHTVC